MTRTSGTLCVAFAVICACGPSSRRGDGNPQGAQIEISPADISVMIVDGAAVVQGYTATLVDVNGNRSDVTNTAQFSLADTRFGSWSGPTLTVTGGGAGPTQVIATDGAVTGSTGLTVFVQSHVNDGPVPPNAPAMFGSATETPGRAPTIAYPANQILVPPNLGTFDVHWQDAQNNLFEVTLKNQYVDVRIYKQISAAPMYTTYSPDEWYSVASSHEPLALTVAGMNTATPSQKGTSAPQVVNVTNEVVQGGVYYWTTRPTQGVYRYDMSTPNVPPSSFFPMGTQPTPCIGCHALSQDGTKMALTLGAGQGTGSIFNVADRSALVPYGAGSAPCTPNATTQCWNFATFTPDASKLVTVFSGQMVLRTTAGGAIISSVPSDPSRLATDPELSPDGTKLANVETTADYYDFDVSDGSIVTRSFDTTTNTFGAIQMLVPNATGASNYYPSWSPDGQWLAFTRTTGNSYNDSSAQVWVVKADGSMPPIQLQLADMTTSLTNSWARWTPFQQSFGQNHELVFYLTFSTTRAFGVRATGGTQIWMAPFFPDRAVMGMDPSGPAFHMPFQELDTSNHIAQWTHQIVIASKPDGSPLSQAEAYGVQLPAR